MPQAQRRVKLVVQSSVELSVEVAAVAAPMRRAVKEVCPEKTHDHQYSSLPIKIVLQSAIGVIFAEISSTSVP